MMLVHNPEDVFIAINPGMSTGAEGPRLPAYLETFDAIAGINGGELVAQGTVEEIKACEESITGQFLSGSRSIAIPSERRKGTGKYLTVKGAAQNNLKDIDVRFPLGKFICVTGVSGSGKSSLVGEILYKAVANEMYNSKERPGRQIKISARKIRVIAETSLEEIRAVDYRNKDEGSETILAYHGSGRIG